MSGGEDPLLLTARFSLLLLFGAACFSLYAPPELRRPETAALRVGAPALAGLAALAWIGLLGRELTGGPQIPDLSLLARLCAETVFGRALAAAILTCGLLTLVGCRAASPRWLRVVLSAILLASLAMLGHAAAGVGRSALLRPALMAAHLLAAGAWLGGLPWLATALRRGPPARRFSSSGSARWGSSPCWSSWEPAWSRSSTW